MGYLIIAFLGIILLFGVEILIAFGVRYVLSKITNEKIKIFFTVISWIIILPCMVALKSIEDKDSIWSGKGIYLVHIGYFMMIFYILLRLGYINI